MKQLGRIPCIFGLALLALAIVVPTPAYAKSKSAKNARTRIEAVVQPDGTLQVLERRTVEYTGAYHGFYWEIPEGATELGASSVRVVEAGEYEGGTPTPYPSEDEVASKAFGDADADSLEQLELLQQGTGDAGTCRITKAQSGGIPSTRVDLHFLKEDTTATFYVRYDLAGAVQRWEDTGELYWKFVGDAWDSTSHDVTCRIYVVKPAGATTAVGKDLRAWLHHGPLTGEVSLQEEATVPSWAASGGQDAALVSYAIDAVKDGDFAEARMLFPQAWLEGMDVQGMPRASVVLGQEEQWAQDANGARAAVFTSLVVKLAVAGALGLGTLAAALAMRGVYCRRHAPTFDDEYFRDVPTDDHPAVLSQLYNPETGQASALTATLMRLGDQGVIDLRKTTVAVRSFTGKVKEVDDCLLVLDRSKTNEVADPIDRATIEFLFDYVASCGNKTALPNDTLRLSHVADVARREQDSYLARLRGWQSVVNKELAAKGYDRDVRSGSKLPLAVCAVLDGLYGAFLLLDLMTFSKQAWMGVGFWWVPIPCALALWVVALAIVETCRGMRGMSAEAVEVRAKLVALRRWLKEFTKLDEAVPGDVVLWNRLLVVAVVLGVAGEAMAQLRVALPSLTSSQEFHNTLLWCSSVGDHSVASAMTSGLRQASSAASSSGGGGGASGGGGGGAGGGGGGSY